VWNSIRVRLRRGRCSWRLIWRSVGECDEVGGSWGFWAMGASQPKDVRPRVCLRFPPWPHSSGFTRTLCSYQHWTGWCGAADRVSGRRVMTDTNEAVPSHRGSTGWWLRAVVRETARLSRKGAEVKLSFVFFKRGAERTCWYKSDTQAILYQNKTFL